MSRDQISTLWAFCRGDLNGTAFERWSFDQAGLDELLGPELVWDVLSANYADREEVWKLRQSLRGQLKTLVHCECLAVRDIAAIPMGGDFYFKKVFEPLERMASYGPERWWLYIDKCKVCSTIWLIAQDERNYDEFFFVRIDQQILADALVGAWPRQFETYEDVLRMGRQLCQPPRFYDWEAGALVASVQDLLRSRPEITPDEIGYLLGLTREHVVRLIEKGRQSKR